MQTALGGGIQAFGMRPICAFHAHPPGGAGHGAPRQAEACPTWTVVESNFKWFGRVKCLKTVVEAVSKALDYKPADPVIEAQARKPGGKAGRPGKKTGGKPHA